jgi:gamma-glutamyltranspeptidase/glutathione hydrolase
MTRFSRALLIAAMLLLSPALCVAQTAPAVSTVSSERVVARNGMVATQERRASAVGVEILQRGGNAVDAAVAMGFALAVTYPQAGNLGGGGFMVIRLAGRNESITVDYRESAPAATTADVFLDEHGEADPRKSRESGLAIGVPGTVAGLALAHQKYGSGKFTLADLIAPAIRLARDGIAVDDDLADSLPRYQQRLVRWPSSAKIFLKPDGVALGTGDTLVQSDLAASLEAIAREGPRVFYEGPIGEKIVAAVRAAGGRMTRDDLVRYRAIERAPLRGNYRGHEIIAMPPPSSGGVHLIEMLNILEGWPLDQSGAERVGVAHLMIEAMKLAYADRAKFLGDPDFVKVPVESLTSKLYAKVLAGTIDAQRARPARDIAPGGGVIREGDNTTHFSVIDSAGNAVANTYTLNFIYGVGLVADGTGILLNNELDDFAAKPGVPNAYGLVGDVANAPGPGKRPLSSMTPTIVLKDGRPFLITGSPGGSRIITTVLQVIHNVIDGRMSIADAVAAPRLHHQWLPDEVVVERTFPTHLIRSLEERGHKVTVGGTWSSANSILATPERLFGAADPRTRGATAAGY